MRLKWNESIKTGYENIDEQHKELFSRLNSFLDAANNGSAKQEILRTLDYLEEYVIIHFKDEEKIQEENNYPKYQLHSIQHELFKNQLGEIRYICEKYGIYGAVVNSFERKLIDFWDYHINKLDKELANFLKECDAIQY